MVSYAQRKIGMELCLEILEVGTAILTLVAILLGIAGGMMRNGGLIMIAVCLFVVVYVLTSIYIPTVTPTPK